MRKRIYFSTIDKDVRRVLGKRLYKKCHEENGFIVAERSNGDAEYHLNYEAYSKLMNYMRKHMKSRLAKAFVLSDTDFHIRFEIDSWQ